MANYLILLTLHLLGDFYFQTPSSVKYGNGGEEDSRRACRRGKRAFDHGALLRHSLLYAAPFLFLFFITKWSSALILIATLAVSHYITDAVSRRLNKKCKRTLVFIGDQLFHSAVLFAAYMIFDFRPDLLQYASTVRIVFSVLLLVLPSCVLIDKLFQDLFADPERQTVFEVGAVIGILERILVFIFACFEDFAAIAIIITIKTWARSNDLKDRIEFRNKYLLGTLASLVLSLIAFLIYKLPITY